MCFDATCLTSKEIAADVISVAEDSLLEPPLQKKHQITGISHRATTTKKKENGEFGHPLHHYSRSRAYTLKCLDCAIDN